MNTKLDLIAALTYGLGSLRKAEIIYTEIEKHVLFSLFGYRPANCHICVLKRTTADFQDIDECLAQKYRPCVECRGTCPLPEKE